MKLPLYQIDAFTSEVFKGNYAAVVPLQQWLPDTMLQAIATENNLSETAFLVTADDGHVDIRWFSISNEIDFCGHATLASAFVLFKLHPERHELAMHAETVGHFTVKRQPDGQIEMNFPAQPALPLDAIPAALYDGLSIRPQEVLRNRQAYMAIYATEADVRAITPNVAALLTLAPFDVVVTAPGKHHDFVSRYFWPANGSVEDPVTGSIHTALAPYWGARLGKTMLKAAQVSARLGLLHCRLEADRVMLSGHAVQYLEGWITVPDCSIS